MIHRPASSSASTSSSTNAVEEAPLAPLAVHRRTPRRSPTTSHRPASARPLSLRSAPNPRSTGHLRDGRTVASAGSTPDQPRPHPDRQGRPSREEESRASGGWPRGAHRGWPRSSGVASPPAREHLSQTWTGPSVRAAPFADSASSTAPPPRNLAFTLRGCIGVRNLAPPPCQPSVRGRSEIRRAGCRRRCGMGCKCS